MNHHDIAVLDWDESHGLLPAIVQDATDGKVLMLGYMSRDALERTIAERRVVFFSRSKQRLWMKGETSGHILHVHSVAWDCDRDAILVMARADGPTCHTGARSCFDAGGTNAASSTLEFLTRLESIIESRRATPNSESYTSKLFAQGVRRIAQKVGEEGVEVALAGVGESNSELLDEAADLVFHLLVLLRSRGLSITDVLAILASRHADSAGAKQSTTVAP